METVPAVSQGNFEKLLDKINEEKRIAKELRQKKELEDINSQLNLDRRRDIVKSIASVYHFLRNHLGMPRRDLSVAEFETVENELKKIALQAGIFGKLFDGWGYYLKHGYFSRRRTPFGKWTCNHEWRFHSLFRIFDPDKVVTYSNCTAFPPNLKELLNELFEKRYKK